MTYKAVGIETGTIYATGTHQQCVRAVNERISNTGQVDGIGRAVTLQQTEPPILGEQDPRYLFYTRVGGYYDIGTTKSEWRNVIKTIFTESEIAEMDITGFEKIEVTP